MLMAIDEVERYGLGSDQQHGLGHEIQFNIGTYQRNVESDG